MPTKPECKSDIHHNFKERIELDQYDTLKTMAEQGNFPKDIPTASERDVTKKVGWIHRKGECDAYYRVANTGDSKEPRESVLSGRGQSE
jgi:hypothetical protein